MKAANAPASLRAVTDVVTGLLAQFADLDDATALARQGRRLATAGCVVVGGYPKANHAQAMPGFKIGPACKGKDSP